MAISQAVQNRLETAGYTNTDNPQFAKAAPWIRTAYIGCASLVALGTVLTSPAILSAVILIAAMGAVSPYHPFDVVYNKVIRRVTGTPAIPRQGAPRRFSCGIAVPWLTAAALAFQFDVAIVGYVLGAAFVGIAGLVGTTYICIPSIIYGFVFGRSKQACTAHVGVN